MAEMPITHIAAIEVLPSTLHASGPSWLAYPHPELYPALSSPGA